MKQHRPFGLSDNISAFWISHRRSIKLYLSHHSVNITMKVYRPFLIAVVLNWLLDASVVCGTRSRRYDISLRASFIQGNLTTMEYDGEDSESSRRLVAAMDNRKAYTSSVILRLEADTFITREASILLADEIVSFVASNIQISASITSKYNGTVAIGILAASVTQQFLQHAPSGSHLQVQVDVQGVVLADNQNLDMNLLDFTLLINEAIHSNYDELLRLIEPLVIPPSPPQKIKGSKKKYAVFATMISLAVLFLFCGILSMWYVVKCVHHFRYCDMNNPNKSSPYVESPEDINSKSNSVDEQSMYTTRIGPVADSVGSKFLGTWSFSMSSSDGKGNDDGHESGREFDTRSESDRSIGTSAGVADDDLVDIDLCDWLAK